MARTKIVATLGPASSSPKMFEQLIDAGVDVFRLNFSHGTHTEHKERLQHIRRIARKKNLFIGIIADLSGPKIRCGSVSPDPLHLKKGDRILFATGSRKPQNKKMPVISLEYPGIARDARKGERILVGDGEMELTIDAVEHGNIICTVVQGGLLRSHKGINFPDTHLKLETFTDKDKEDVLFCLKHGVDFFALSFVRNPQDVQKLRDYIREQTKGKNIVPIISKIEKAEALENIQEIVSVSDGVMVARGDLGIEIPLHEVPLAQKSIIKLANDMGKPVITATQMLESMISNPRPTRAEVTDIANAIFDGTDAVMLSGETAVGQFPLEAVGIMDRVAKATEREINYKDRLSKMHIGDAGSVPDAISHATCVTAENLGLEAIVCLTISGQTARMVARYRQRAPILAFSPSIDTLNRLSLSWGVVPAKLPSFSAKIYFEAAVETALEVALDKGYLQSSDRIVITAGLPLLKPGTTDILRVVTIGDIFKNKKKRKKKS